MAAASPKSKMNPRKELIIAASLLMLAVVAWYFTLYQPVEARAIELQGKIRAEQDSLVAIDRYNAEKIALRIKMDRMQEAIHSWDGRFPPRDSVVVIARQLIGFANEMGLVLVEIQPSLFELYALERAGAQIAGKYVMQLPIKFRFQGRYLNFAQMLEQVDQLPFNLTLADVDVQSIPGRNPDVDVTLDLYLYVHL